ncbi:MAG: hypothetical protein J0H81_04475 [Sphingopyxis terrae]|nr:hypothetical protein [Sphingopyxis terrae]
MGDIDWAGRMARLPDEDLVEIASSGEADGYHQLAVDAAVEPSSHASRRR